MKKATIRIYALVICFVFSVVSIAAVATSFQNIYNDDAPLPSGAVTGTVWGDGIPSITQNDIDNDFENYSMEAATTQFPGTRSSADTTSTVVGIVLDQTNESALSGATVSIVGNNELTVTTDLNGRFTIHSVPDGIYDWKIQKDGYYEATYKNYDVCAIAGTTIFTFYISDEAEYVQDRSELRNDDYIQQENIQSEPTDVVAQTASFTSPPALSAFTVKMPNGVVRSMYRSDYLAGVVASEALGEWVCQYTYGLTETQIRQLYKSQAVAANTLLEWNAVSGWEPHSDATVCTTAHCQHYDATKITTLVINAVNDAFMTASGQSYCLLQLYKPTSTSYNYIYGAYFQRCNGSTLTYSGQPALVSVSCTNIDNKYSTSGNGYGMCQYGAPYQAKNGKSSSQILKYYYTNTDSIYCVNPH